MSIPQSQRVLHIRNGQIQSRDLPASDALVVRGVKWGAFDELFTPAFWAVQIWMESPPMQNYRLGTCLVEEIAACLLGGHGMPAELGNAAFGRVRDRGLLLSATSATELESCLAEPFDIRGRPIRYRYPRQKARYLSSALQKFQSEAPPDSPAELRDWLLTFDGIGMKTASWITRNHTSSDEVAILDVHLIRAGLLMGLFPSSMTVQKNYREMEARVVELVRAMGLSLAALDDVIWRFMRECNQTAIESVERRIAA